MERTGTLADAITKILALLLPISQFFLQYLPASFTSIYLGKENFLVVSIIVLLICISLWLTLISQPTFAIPLNIKKHHKYQKELEKSTSETPSSITQQVEAKSDTESQLKRPFYIDQNNIQSLSLVMALISSCAFLWIGINKSPTNEIWVSTQALFYILGIAGFFIVLVVYTLRKRNVEMFNKLEANRPSNAINKAIEGRSFDNFPTVNYIGMTTWQDPNNNQITHVVYVRVASGGAAEDYRIATDFTGDVVYWVLPESTFSDS